MGEREVLKTYGIASTESEVQTKASFLLTSKRTTDELTRQDKAPRDFESLIQDKALFR